MKVRRKSLHRSKNNRRRSRERSAAAIAWAEQTSQLRREAEAAQREYELTAEMAQPPIQPPAFAGPDHTLEVVVKIDGEERTFRAVCLRGEWLGHSGNTITKAIRLVRSAAVFGAKNLKLIPTLEKPQKRA